jgi:hypothetical protein
MSIVSHFQRERERERKKRAKEHDKCERRRKDEKLIENPILLFQKKEGI